MVDKYLDFYLKHDILPWRQDIGDLKIHFQRRASLYRHLGILPGFLRGRTVLEFGPGSGHNSLYTASLGPSRYVLVEPHPTAVRDMEDLFSRFPAWKRGLEIESITLNEYRSEEKFDFVFCEELLSGFPDPDESLRDVARFVADDGVLVITCMDDVSLFPDTLRRLFAQLAIDPDASVEENLKTLTGLFAPHLAQLEGVTRSAESWVLDNMINATWDKHSIPQVIDAIGENFTVFGTSPNFLVDWRWYRNICGAESNINERVVRQYWRNVHNFIDHDRLFSSREELDNRRLYRYCEEGRNLIRQFETSRDRTVIDEFVVLLHCVIDEVFLFSLETVVALRDAEEMLRKRDWVALTNSRSFGRLFGRGMQYISFNKE